MVTSTAPPTRIPIAYNNFRSVHVQSAIRPKNTLATNIPAPNTWKVICNGLAWICAICQRKNNRLVSINIIVSQTGDANTMLTRACVVSCVLVFDAAYCFNSSFLEFADVSRYCSVCGFRLLCSVKFNNLLLWKWQVSYMENIWGCFLPVVIMLLVELLPHRP